MKTRNTYSIHLVLMIVLQLTEFLASLFSHPLLHIRSQLRTTFAHTILQSLLHVCLVLHDVLGGFSGQDASRS